MSPCLAVVLTLNHERGQEEAHFEVNTAAAALYHSIQALLCLDLQAVAQAKLGELFPLGTVVRVVYQVVYKVALSILNVANRVELLSKTVELLGGVFTIGLHLFVFAGGRDVLELRHDV